MEEIKILRWDEIEYDLLFEIQGSYPATAQKIEREMKRFFQNTITSMWILPMMLYILKLDKIGYIFGYNNYE